MKPPGGGQRARRYPPARRCRRVRPGLLLLPLVLALLPSAAGQEGDPLCIVFFEPSDDFRRMLVRADLILTPEERNATAAEVDADGDGVLTRGEVAAYEAGSRVELGNDTSQYGERLLWMDGEGPVRATFARRLTNWTGPVAQARMGAVTEIREYEMRPSSDFAHVLSGGANSSRPYLAVPVVETVVFTAPPGWVVYQAKSAPEGQPPFPMGMGSRNDAPVHNERSVTLSAFDTRSAFLVVFAEEGRDPYEVRGGGMPGPGALLVAGALAVAALAWRASRAGR